MTLPTLPRDVLATIVNSGSFSKHDLCMISLASPHLRYEAQRTLFRDPGQHCINVGADTKDPLTARSFLQALISSPDRLALFVRRYHVTLTWHEFTALQQTEKVDKQRKLQNTVFNRLSRGLPLMANLTVLQLYTDNRYWSRSEQSRPPSMFSILKRCTFRLEGFRCSYSRSADYKDRKLVHNFLRNQEGVRELWIREIRMRTTSNNNSDQLDMFQNVCPSAVSVGGTPGIIIGMLLSGRRLQHVCWEGSFFEKYDDMLPTARFRSVELMESFAGGPGLSLMCTSFGNLVLLKTKGTGALLGTPEPLSDLPRLRALFIVFDPRFSQSLKGFLSCEEQRIRRLFCCSLSLEYVEIHNNEGGRKYIIYRTSKTVSVYIVPADIALQRAESKEELLQRVHMQRVNPKDVLLKIFLL